jgi:hypothetical protein
VEPVTTLILTALAFGAREVASEAVKDSYKKLKGLIQRKFAGNQDAETALVAYEKDPDTWEPRLRDLLAQTGAVKETDIIEVSQNLITHINPQQAASGKYNVQITGNVQGYVQGDHVQVTMNFTNEQQKK